MNHVADVGGALGWLVAVGLIGAVAYKHWPRVKAALAALMKDGDPPAAA